jgi:hypothetical protein
MYKLLPLALFVGIVAGCYASLDSYIHRLSRIACVKTEECLPEQFAAEYDSVGDCIDEIEAANAMAWAGCSYDAKRGRECVHTMYRRRKDCSTLRDPPPAPECEAVVFCPRIVQVDESAPGRLLRGLVVASADPPPDAVPLD